MPRIERQEQRDCLPPIGPYSRVDLEFRKFLPACLVDLEQTTKTNRRVRSRTTKRAGITSSRPEFFVASRCCFDSHESSLSRFGSPAHMPTVVLSHNKVSRVEFDP